MFCSTEAPGSIANPNPGGRAWLPRAVQPLHHQEVVCSDQYFSTWHKVYKICMSLQHILRDQNKYPGVLCFPSPEVFTDVSCIKHVEGDNGLHGLCLQFGETSQKSFCMNEMSIKV